jgi:hypothetical protein
VDAEIAAAAAELKGYRMPQSGRRSSDRAYPTGLAVDASGGPVIDPTANVVALTKAAVQRLDDVQNLHNLLTDEKVRRIEREQALHSEIGALRAQHQRDLDALESKRLDAVRTVDQVTSKTEADRQAAAVAALAAAAATTAETLRSAVNTSATNLATQLDRTVTQITERIAALEKSSYTGEGKQTVADPMLGKMLDRMETVLGTQTRVAGKSEGINAMWLVIVGAVGLLGTLVMMGALAVTLVVFLSRPTAVAPPAYLNAPPGTMLPSPPSTVPR